MSRLRIGVDLGGTKTELRLLDETGEERLRQRTASPRGDYGATLANVASLVEGAEGELGARASVGVAIPGAVSPSTGRVKNANSTWLNGHPLHRDLADRLGRPVGVANDANCFALSEATDGAGANAHSLFGVIVGTGTGAGIALAGQVLTGANAIAGEWGHNPLPWPDAEETPGPPCYCGRRGCIETFLSGPGLSAEHERRTGSRLEPDAIIAGAAAGETACERTLACYEHRMARGLAHVINLLDPEVIVLGGGLGNVNRLYRRLPQPWDPFVFSDRLATRLVPPVHGDASGARGAARLGPDPGD